MTLRRRGFWPWLTNSGWHFWCPLVVVIAVARRRRHLMVHHPHPRHTVCCCHRAVRVVTAPLCVFIAPSFDIIACHRRRLRRTLSRHLATPCTVVHRRRTVVPLSLLCRLHHRAVVIAVHRRHCRRFAVSHNQHRALVHDAWALQPGGWWLRGVMLAPPDCGDSFAPWRALVVVARAQLGVGQLAPRSCAQRQGLWAWQTVVWGGALGAVRLPTPLLWCVVVAFGGSRHGGGRWSTSRACAQRQSLWAWLTG